MVDLSALYDFRFGQTGVAKRRAVWRVLCNDFFAKLIPDGATVLDIACGYGEFINQIPAAHKLAVDLNPDAPKHLAPDVTFHHTSATDMHSIADGSVDVVFTSNFLEHFPDKPALDCMLREVHRIVRPGGSFIVLGPNIRYAYREYWDYYDHYLPLSHLSLVEALILAGFKPGRVIDRFLPYTMNNGAPTADWVIKLYLRLPFAWKLFGKQFLVVGTKPR